MVRWRSRTGPLVAAVLLACASAPVLAQSRLRVVQPEGLGILSGKLTDLHSAPLAGVTIILRNEATGAELHGTTRRNGAYRFIALPPGEYTLVAETANLGRGSFQGIEVDAGAEARIETAVRLEPVTADETRTTATQAPAAPPSAEGGKEPELADRPARPGGDLRQNRCCRWRGQRLPARWLRRLHGR
jgi:hypothetical protein